MLPSLQISVSQPSDENYEIISFVGDFDKAGYGDVNVQLNDLVKKFDKKYLLFDFSKMKFINSEGIGYLTEIHAHLVNQGKKLILVGPNDHVRDVFTTIGIAELIPIYGTFDEAKVNLA